MPPKNPWTYKRRKRNKQKKNSCSVPEVELTEKSQLPEPGDIYIGVISDLFLNKPVKKEYNYPDTRFKRSTTLFPAKAVEENCLPSETPCEISKRCAEEELISTSSKKLKISSDSTETVEPTISDVVTILEAPKTQVKVEVIDLTDESLPIYPILCSPVSTSFLQNRLPGKQNTTLQDNVRVKNESSEKTCEVIATAIDAADINYHAIQTKSEQNKVSENSSEVNKDKYTVGINIPLDNPPHIEVKPEKIIPSESNNKLNFDQSPIVPPFNNRIQIKTEQNKSNESHNEVNFEKSHVAISRHADTATFRTPLLKYMNCYTKVDVLKISYALLVLNNLIKDKEKIIQINLEDNCLSTICLSSLDDNKQSETSDNLPIPIFSKDFLHQILVNAKSKKFDDIRSSLNPVDSVVQLNIVMDESEFKNCLKNKQVENMNPTSDANEKNSEFNIKNSENVSKSLALSNGFKPTQGVLFHPPATFSNSFENPVKRVKLCEDASLFKSGCIRTSSHEEYIKRGTRIMDSPYYPPDHRSKHLTSNLPFNLPDSSPSSSNFEQNMFTPPGNHSLIYSDTSLQNSSYSDLANANYSWDPRLSHCGFPALLRDVNSQQHLASLNRSHTYLSQSVPEAMKSPVHSRMKQTPSVSTFYAMQNTLIVQSSDEPFRRASEEHRHVLLPSPASGSSSSITECNSDQSVEAVKGRQPLLSEKNRRILLSSPASGSSSSMTQHNPEQSVEAVKSQKPLLSEKNRRILLPSPASGSLFSMAQHNPYQPVKGHQPLLSAKKRHILLPSPVSGISSALTQHNPGELRLILQEQ
ncbi:hypothetical protein AVEN_260277-1 [Araneus ventricosus]|uniref:Uncharacterized protein n=1 Tax=Araneus ventricosus TaxID=182803 RepID=A0A4Y2FM69_ARAVE|nr:hypothetical protein AVEN_260277-1 [Araneus ventricosus]